MRRRGWTCTPMAVVTAGFTGATVVAADAAAAGCRADYMIGSRWTGGFIADVRVTKAT